MDLNNEMQVLVNKIKAPSIFYIPKKLLSEFSKKDAYNLAKIGFFDTMFIINKQGVNKPVTNVNELLLLFDKAKILTSNVFQILVCKAQLDNATFHYLLVEYLKDLGSWIRVIKVVKDDAKKDLHYYKPYFQSYLDMQYNHLMNHQSELKKKFGYWKTEFEIGRIFNDSNFKLPKQQPKVDLNFNKINEDTKEQTKKSTVSSNPIKHKKKPLILSDADADSYLLKTVFNVNFNNTNVEEREK